MVKHLFFLALFMLTPVSLLLVHALKGTGLMQSLGLVGDSTGVGRVPIGVLVNERDNMSYASWAEQARLGHYLATDLYTTDIHRAAFFNPYFSLMGLISRAANLAPFFVMVLTSIAASGLFGYVIYKLARQTGLRRKASVAAVFVTLFCSGPSWMLFFFHAAFAPDGALQRPFLGIDGYYFDIFPVTIFLAYPFAGFNLLFVAATTLLIIRTLSPADGPGWGRLLPAALGCACAVLIRPYDALLLCLLFPLCAYVRGFSRTGKLVLDRGRLAMCVGIGALVLPSCLYVSVMAQLPVWQDFAKGSITIGPSRVEMALGFSVLWVFAVCGVRRAIREANENLWFLICWSVTMTVCILAFGGAMARFSSGVVIPYSILAVYGIEGLCIHPVPRLRRLSRFAIAALASTAITSAFDYASILMQPVPTVDRNVFEAALKIRQEAGRAIPTVLTDCSSATFLSGVAGLRVFSGHWSLTPDYKVKCALLENAGFATTPQKHRFDADVFTKAMQDAQPDYVIVRHDTPAERQILSTHRASTILQTAEWSTFSISSHAASKYAAFSGGTPAD